MASFWNKNVHDGIHVYYIDGQNTGNPCVRSGVITGTTMYDEGSFWDTVVTIKDDVTGNITCKMVSLVHNEEDLAKEHLYRLLIGLK